MTNLPRLVLASASPRRRALLTQLGIPFEAVPTNADETPPKGLTGAAAVEAIAERKLDAYLATRIAKTPEFVLAVDTEVYLNGRLFGKPADRVAAEKMLNELQGTGHIVYSALVVATPDGRRLRRLVASKVTIAPLNAQQIASYAATKEPLDKAGGYAVQGQGAAFIQQVDGDYTNVIGLPLRATLELLTEARFPLPPHLQIS